MDPNPPPADLVDRGSMLLEYVSGGRVAIITVNRPPSGATAATEFDVIKQRALA